MPVRRKRNHTLRFKPDLWGRVPEEEGTVLFDGTVTLEDGEGTITLSSAPVMGRIVTLGYNGEEIKTVVPNVYAGDSLYFYADGEFDISFVVQDDDLTTSVDAYDGNGDPIDGEIGIKIEQSPTIPALTSLYEGTVQLTLSGGDFQSMVGQFNLNRAINDGEFIYAYQGGTLKGCNTYMGGTNQILWPDGNHTVSVTYEGGEECVYSTDDLSVSSVNIKIAVAAT